MAFRDLDHDVELHELSLRQRLSSDVFVDLPRYRSVAWLLPDVKGCVDVWRHRLQWFRLDGS